MSFPLPAPWLRMPWRDATGPLAGDGSPRIMGIVNATPDSFSDGGRYLDPARAIAQGLELGREGAHILDIGGESSRPGATPVSEAEELERIARVVEQLAAEGLIVSIDTTKAAVAREAVRLGAPYPERHHGFGGRLGDGSTRGRVGARPSWSCTCAARRKRCNWTRPTTTWWARCTNTWPGVSRS